MSHKSTIDIEWGSGDIFRPSRWILINFDRNKDETAAHIAWAMFKIKWLCPGQGSMLEREIAEISCHITGKDLTPDSVIPAKPRTMSPPYLHTPDSWCSLFFLNIAMRGYWEDTFLMREMRRPRQCQWGPRSPQEEFVTWNRLLSEGWETVVNILHKM